MEQLIKRLKCKRCNSSWVYVRVDGTIVCRQCGCKEKPGGEDGG